MPAAAGMSTKHGEVSESRTGERVPGRILMYLAVCISVFGFGVAIGGMSSHRCEISYVARDEGGGADSSTLLMQVPTQLSARDDTDEISMERLPLEREEMEPRVIVVNKDGLVDVAVSDLSFDTTAPQEGSGDTHALEACPFGTPKSDEVRLLIAVTSTCCTPRSRQNRDAIRRTWMMDGLLEHGDVVSIKFVLSTPPVSSASEAAGVRDVLRSELSSSGSDDVVMLGYALEAYENLSLKTIGIHRYMSLSSCEYTHLLKTDDDVYIRVPGALSMLGYPHTRWIYPEHLFERDPPRSPFIGLYLGKVSTLGNPYSPHRDKTSKWYLSHEEWPDGMRVRNYNVGWAYMMSADVSAFVVHRMDHYARIYDHVQQRPESPARAVLPKNYLGMLKIEDVMTGYLLAEKRVYPLKANVTKEYWSQDQLDLTKKWQYQDEYCPPETVFKHLDHDNLILMPVLSVNDRTGTWKHRHIQCYVRERDREAVDERKKPDPVPELVTYELYTKADGGFPGQSRQPSSPID